MDHVLAQEPDRSVGVASEAGCPTWGIPDLRPCRRPVRRGKVTGVSNRRLGVVLAAVAFTVGLVVVAVVATGGDDTPSSVEETQRVLSAAEVLLDQEGIQNYDLGALDLAVQSLIDSCENDDTTGFLLTYALTLQGSDGNEELARAVVEAACPARLDELDQAGSTGGVDLSS